MTNSGEILEADLSWREAELASLKRLAIANRENKTAYLAMLRASCALLYAHFEGFTKFSWEHLLDTIETEEIAVDDLHIDFKTLALENMFKKLRGNLDSQSLLFFFTSQLPAALEDKAKFAEDCRLETECNLWPNIFERECARIGVASTELESWRTRIRSLVSRRNEIAHGKKMVINSVEEYSEFENAVLMVLHDLAVQVLDIIEKQKHIAS